MIGGGDRRIKKEIWEEVECVREQWWCNCSPEEFGEAPLKSLCGLVITVIKGQRNANSKSDQSVANLLRYYTLPWAEMIRDEPEFIYFGSVPGLEIKLMCLDSLACCWRCFWNWSVLGVVSAEFALDILTAVCFPYRFGTNSVQQQRRRVSPWDEVAGFWWSIFWHCFYVTEHQQPFTPNEMNQVLPCVLTGNGQQSATMTRQMVICSWDVIEGNGPENEMP